MNANLVDFILSCADAYYDENLKGYDKDRIRSDWWEALDFFLGHACYQGRSNSVSDLVYGAAKSALAPYFAGSDRNSMFETLKEGHWSELELKLREKIGKGHVGKERDVRMILSALDYLSLLPDRNIVNRSIEVISSSQLRGHFFGLQPGQAKAGIVQVGPKIAAFYLRDVVSLFNLDRFVDADSAFCLQPIDTWVRRLAGRLEIAGANADDLEIQSSILRTCAGFKVSPFRFNQGIWYFGTHTLEIALKLAAERNSCSNA
jgi:hypothetical protein